MRKVMVLLLVACLMTAVVVAFAQGRQPGQGRQGRGGQQVETFTVALADGKIYALKSDVIFKITADDMKVEKKKKLDLPEDANPWGRRMRLSLKVEGKNLYLVGYNVIHRVKLDTLEVAGTLKASDLKPPEEEKKDEGKEEGDDKEEEDF
jgi:hypothetical protein